jgi:hypothetical protein
MSLILFEVSAYHCSACVADKHCYQWHAIESLKMNRKIVHYSKRGLVWESDHTDNFCQCSEKEKWKIWFDAGF